MSEGARVRTRVKMRGSVMAQHTRNRTYCAIAESVWEEPERQSRAMTRARMMTRWAMARVQEGTRVCTHGERGEDEAPVPRSEGEGASSPPHPCCMGLGDGNSDGDACRSIRVVSCSG